MEQSGFQWFMTALKKYAVFNGRSRRKEYWYFALFSNLISIPLTILAESASIFGIISLVYSLAILVPSIAAGVRRMHDVGKSGWFLLIPFYNLYLAVSDSEPGTNEYGPNPKNPELAIEDHLVG